MTTRGHAALRILIQGMNFAPEVIGVGKYTTQLAQYLSDRGHAVEVVTALPHYPGWQVRASRRWSFAQSRENGVAITRCPLLARPGGGLWRIAAPLSFALAAAPVVLWRSLVFRPDVILCVEPTLFAAPAALLGARLSGARLALHVQDLEIDAAFATGHLKGGRLRAAAAWMERALLRRMHAVVTISDAMAARLQHRGVAAARLTVLRNWIGPPGRPGAPRSCDWPVPPGRRSVLYAGNLGVKQGLAVLIEAARRLRCRTDLQIVVVGDGPLAPALRAAAASLPNLTVRDVVSSDQLPAFLAAADCHVLPQDRAAGDLVFPSKLGPILASGKPCVITSEAWHELGRWVGPAATIVPPGDGQVLAEALARAACRPDDRDAALPRALAASLDAGVILAQFEAVLVRVARRLPVNEAPRAMPERGYASA